MQSITTKICASALLDAENAHPLAKIFLQAAAICAV
jgi:hypothetical protein